MKSKRNDLLQLIITLSIILVASFVLTGFFFKWDLTEEKRHSLTPATIEMLEKLDDNIFIRCYLHGEFPAEFKRLEQSIQERLDEFRDYSEGKIDYEFIDPYAVGDKKQVQEVFKALDEKGLQFTNISFDENGTQSSKLIWPAAILEYQGKEYAVQFFKSEMAAPGEAMINNSVNNLEYELASSLRKITRSKKPAIGVLQGHKELNELQMADLLYGLNENYALEPVYIDSQVDALSDKLDNMKYRVNRYDALIIAGTDSLVNDKERVIIDQYLMNGGKILWLVDALKMNMDSLRGAQTAMALSNENGFYEMLFEYGVRLNRALVIDFQGAPIILDDGPKGNQRNYVDRTNYYSPLMLSPNNPHPITSNLDPIKLEFAGSLDSVNPNPEVTKIKILQTSELAKELKAPARVDLELLRFGPEYFKTGNKPNQIIGMILEGQFPSAFKDVLGPVLRNSPDFAFRDKSAPTKMIVIADADIARNKVSVKDGKPMPLPLGYEPQFRRVIYDNKEFLLNCMNYLLDDQALISVRSRSIELRKLDDALVQEYRTRIKLENTALPIGIVLLTGGIHYWLRRKKWATVEAA